MEKATTKGGGTPSGNMQSKPDLSIWKNFKYDIPAGLVVFLVAIPLCLGIALASSPNNIFAGILAGILGGLIVPLISRSPLSVSGPAAGLIAIVIVGIDNAGSFEAFLLAVMLGGILQIILGLLKAGTLAYFFPTSVIKGMLAAIGLILILKQFPHALGYDVEAFDFMFQGTEDENTFSMIGAALSHIEPGAFVISIVSLFILIFWNKTPLKNVTWLPAALVVVIGGILMNMLFGSIKPEWVLSGGAKGHLVNLPEINGFKGFYDQLVFPDFSAIGNSAIWVTAFTLGIVASVETLLSVEAVDKLDPHKRSSPLSRELIAQGAANTLAGLLGALPITAVIVRSSANVASGGQTRMASIIHGIFLFGSVITIGSILRMIPLASLACILLLIGYKLANPKLFKQMYQNGMNQFAPFVITILAVLATDLLKGIGVGILVGIFFTIRDNFKTAITVKKENEFILLKFNKDVSFLNKANIREALTRISPGSKVIVDGSMADFIDRDIREILEEFKIRAEENNVDLRFRGIHPDLDTEYNVSFEGEGVTAVSNGSNSSQSGLATSST
ncbi:MAG: SulP family inorganic anion transporter [Bacteroidota bacterium]